MPELSYETKRSLIQSAIKELYPGEGYAWVEDMTDGKAIYSYNDKHYQASYFISEDNQVKLGTPAEVMRQITYKGVTLTKKGKRIGG